MDGADGCFQPPLRPVANPDLPRHDNMDVAEGCFQPPLRPAADPDPPRGYRMGVLEGCSQPTLLRGRKHCATREQTACPSRVRWSRGEDIRSNSHTAFHSLLRLPSQAMLWRP